MAERVPGVELSLDKEDSLRFTEREARTVWGVEIQSDKMMKGQVLGQLNSHYTNVKM